MFEVGKVIEVEGGLGYVAEWRSGCILVRPESVTKEFGEISGDDESLLERFEAQTLKGDLRVAREEGAVVAGKCRE